MALKIKKPNYLNSSLVSWNDIKDNPDGLENDHPFVILKDLLEKSWSIKNNDLKIATEEQLELEKKKGLNITLDSLKNKSLITYIDAPWGSGKTHFIETFIKWIKKNKNNEEINFKFGEEETTLEIDFIDAWEIYQSGNIEDFLLRAFTIDWKEFKKFYKKGKDVKRFCLKWLKKLGRIPISLSNVLVSGISFNIGVPGANIELDLGEKIRTLKEELNKLNNEPYDPLKDKELKLEEEEKLLVLLVSYLEWKYKNNNKFIIIDNIERLSSKNRLNVVNKILNWANLSGITFLFLSNFEKINFTKLQEEDFWNKISLHETFKLTNNWQTYIDNYKYEADNFAMSDSKNSDLKEFIKIIIPTFFSNNKDDMDIREIKKLLDNWEGKSNTDSRELITSLLNEIVEKNLEGLDKYFLINHSISWLSENKWDLWSDSELENDKVKENNISLINNKMFRIQSNFYELEVEVKNDVLVFKDSDKLKIKEQDLIHFKNFNNFIDDNATNKFKDVVESILKTRKIDNKDNYIYLYIEYIKSKDKNKDSVKYFEFKYNNIKKLHIYNEIFNK